MHVFFRIFRVQRYAPCRLSTILVPCPVICLTLCTHGVRSPIFRVRIFSIFLHTKFVRENGKTKLQRRTQTKHGIQTHDTNVA